MERNNKKRQRVLVIAAHPDDEVLGCGGTMAAHRDADHEVSILILGEGMMARSGLAPAHARNLQQSLHKDSQRAAKILGVRRHAIKSFPDNQFDTVPLLSLVHTIEKEIAAWQPEIIYTHDWHDVNIDHRRTAEAVEAAVRPVAGAAIKRVLSFGIPSSSEWNFARPTHFAPHVFQALTPVHLKKKLAAMAAYRSELRAFPHPRSLEYLEALARVRGGQSGYHAAEAFSLVYELRDRV